MIAEWTNGEDDWEGVGIEEQIHKIGRIGQTPMVRKTVGTNRYNGMGVTEFKDIPVGSACNLVRNISSGLIIVAENVLAILPATSGAKVKGAA